ncbi:MAG: hypothetical protein KU37_11760 [Sulfuricurvum sp. PC08-66]|nr:MAG: hypothetical protein KU37_11760 [Sulfuricurvum sp. PC08-66]
MLVKFSEQFEEEFVAIYFYIAQDSQNRAEKFRNGLFSTIDTLQNHPMKCRKSRFHIALAQNVWYDF